MSDFNLPPAPDPVKVEQWAGLLRNLIAALSGAGLLGAAWAGVSAQQIGNVLTAFLTLAGAAGAAYAAFQSWQQKAKARAKEVASANASAQLGQPVTVTVTPAGQPNIVSKVSATEVAQAPSAPINVEPSPAPIAP